MNKKTIYIALHLLLCFSYTCYFFTNTAVSSENMKMMGVFGWLQIILSYISWEIVTGKLVVPYMVFLTTAYIFTFGQSFLEVFGLVAESRALNLRCSETDIYLAQYYTLLFMMAFHVGAIVSFKKTFFREPIELTSKYYIEKNAIKKIGLTLTTISVIPFIIENAMNMIVVSNYGYKGLYDNSLQYTGSAVIGFLADFFIPGMICILLTTKSNSLKQKNILFLFSLFILVIMYCGGRSQGAILVAIAILYYHNYVKAFTMQKWILIGVFGVVFVSSLSAIAHLRGGTRENYIESIVNYKSDENPFFETISEMGGSMHPMARTIDLVPRTEDYRYGSTYLYACTSLIPNLGFWKKHPAAVNANLGEWLMKKDNLGYGPGYSLVAEAYINWGPFGFVLMFFIGYYFYKILSIEGNRKLRILSLLIALIFSYMSLKMVRNSFIGSVRVLAFYIFPIYWYVSHQVKKSVRKRITSGKI